MKIAPPRNEELVAPLLLDVFTANSAQAGKRPVF